MLSRRDLYTGAAGLALTHAARAAAPKSKMGLAVTSYLGYRRIRDAETLLEHAATLGCAGIQAGPPKDPAKFRARCEALGMFYEAMVPLPKGDAGAFAEVLRKAKEAGAAVARCGALSGRRYETFSTMSDWKTFVAASKESVRLAVPVAEKEKIGLALENHKDWVIEEHLALLKEYSSPYLGACLDTGNNIALLDDPMRVVRELAPYALTTHMKDMDYQESGEGFLLSEVPFGAGRLDLREIVRVVSQARPQTRFVLEMITRNPLVIPCFTTKYWATFPDRPAPLLAGTMAAVKARRDRTPLPRFDHLPPDAQVEAEEQNIRTCLNYGREQLAL